MPRPQASALQRIKVGLGGLLAVVLFAIVAAFFTDRWGKQGAIQGPITDDKSASAPDEPLAELGATPKVNEDAAKASQAKPQ